MAVTTVLERDTIRTVRLRKSSGDNEARSRQMIAMLQQADIGTGVVAPQAVLCIRRVNAPRLRQLRSGGILRPSVEWESATREALARLAASAVRPARGPVSLGAEAVLFADRAELLACLARDWCDGVVAACWWWRALFPTTDAAATVVRAWRETPEQMPAACQVLATWNRLTPFVRRLAPADVASLTHAVARAFGLDAVVRVLAMRGTPRSSSGTAIDHESGIAATAPAAVLDAHVPEFVATSLAPEQRVLAMVNLLLHRAPSDAARMLSADTVASILKGEPQRELPIVAAPVTEPIVAAPVTEMSGEERGWPSTTQTTVAPGREAHASADIEMFAAPAREVTEGVAPIEPPPEAATTSSPSDVGAFDGSGSSADLALPHRTPRPVEAIVETAFGGAFYLINVGIALGLYGDFTMPLSPGLDLPIWDFIALVTTRLVADEGERLAADPLLPFLGQLAGRAPSEAPGAHRVPPRSWTLPAEWHIGLDEPGDAETYERWADWLAPRIAARLARALRVEKQVAGHLLIRCGARVSLSPSHLDVAFALDDLPIEVRIAGLDRDPGFVPAAALTVGFSYV